MVLLTLWKQRHSCLFGSAIVFSAITRSAGGYNIARCVPAILRQRYHMILSKFRVNPTHTAIGASVAVVGKDRLPFISGQRSWQSQFSRAPTLFLTPFGLRVLFTIITRFLSKLFWIDGICSSGTFLASSATLIKVGLSVFFGSLSMGFKVVFLVSTHPDRDGLFVFCIILRLFGLYIGAVGDPISPIPFAFTSLTKARKFVGIFSCCATKKLGSFRVHGLTPGARLLGYTSIIHRTLFPLGRCPVLITRGRFCLFNYSSKRTALHGIRV